MSVSIIIKTLNEEERIGAAVESALTAAGTEGEVIVADSRSNDRTTQIAARFPVLVVELADPAERCCGIGPQMGYQFARGDYIALIDGDMQIDVDFIRQAIRFLDDNPRHAGVAGRVDETNLDNLEFARRVRRAPADMRAGDVDRLNGGGVFRRAAIEDSGYFTDRGLHAYEEFELAARLRSRGWRLARLDIPFVRHYGHRVNAYPLLMRRWQSGYVLGLGEVVRAALGRPHARLVLALPEIRLWAMVAASWLVAVLALLLAPNWAVGIAVATAIQLAPVALMSWRYRSLAMGVYSVVAWHVNALGFLRGLIRRRPDPRSPVRARVVSDARQRRPVEHGTAAP